jgi:hypothetical protein
MQSQLEQNYHVLEPLQFVTARFKMSSFFFLVFPQKNYKPVILTLNVVI